MHTYDSAMARAKGWKFLDKPAQTHDGKTVDSAGAFLISELERLDPTMHAPLASVTWSRDVDLREDVTIADETSSFTNTTGAATGGITPTGIAWAGKNTTTIPGIAADIAKTANPLVLWEMELKYSIPELESAIKLGRPIDTQKLELLKLKYEMDTDQVVYVGDSTMNMAGLFNNASITTSTAAIGGLGTSTWATKTPMEILADINTLLTNTWTASGYAVIPDRLLLPPPQYTQLISQTVSTAGNVSLLTFLEQNNLASQRGGRLEIYPAKWAIGMGVGGTPQVAGTVDRAMAYSKDPLRVRYPKTALLNTPVQYQGMYHVTTYYCRLGQVEFVYPSTMSYLDGILSTYAADDVVEKKFAEVDVMGEVGAMIKRKSAIL